MLQLTDVTTIPGLPYLILWMKLYETFHCFLLLALLFFTGEFEKLSVGLVKFEKHWKGLTALLIGKSDSVKASKDDDVRLEFKRRYAEDTNEVVVKLRHFLKKSLKIIHILQKIYQM